MSRKKLVNTIGDKEDFIYCDARNCPYKQCFRKITSASFDELLTVHRYNLDKNGKCEGLLEE